MTAHRDLKNSSEIAREDWKSYTAARLMSCKPWPIARRAAEPAAPMASRTLRGRHSQVNDRL